MCPGEVTLRFISLFLHVCLVSGAWLEVGCGPRLRGPQTLPEAWHVPYWWYFPFSLQCVKALVYYDLQSCRLDIGNEKGDTPLHIAARWGYQGIIETLLQNGASTEIQNRLKETPLKCALNSKVAFLHLRASV